MKAQNKHRKHLTRIGAVIACVYLLNFVLPAIVQAEDPPIPAEMLPADIPPLPSSKERSGGLLIGPETAEKYKDLLVEPLFTWIKQRKFAFRAVRGLDYVWKLPESFETASARVETKWILAESGSPERNPAVKDDAPALPFGNKTIIESEKDPDAKAKKILWNVLYMENLAEEFRYTFEMTWSGSQILRRRADLFLYQRFFPALLSEQPFLSQSLLKFVTPQAALNYGLIGWIFRDEMRARFWIYSPPIQRLREILAANRSDGILGGSITTDDIFVWSGDIKRFSAKVTGEKLVFVFFPSTKPYGLISQATDVSPTETPEPAGSPSATATAASGKLPPAIPNAAVSSLAVTGLREKPTGGGTVTTLWNHDLKQFPQLPPWVPVSIAGVPRKVWTIELFPNDPFYEAGREVLYVDQELMLPVMKVTSDRIGEFQKFILGGWGLAEKKDKSSSTSLPFFAFEVAIEQGDMPVTALTTTGFRKFTGKETAGIKALRAQLQPEAHGKARDAGGEKPKPSPKPAAADGAKPEAQPEEDAPVD